MSQASNAFDMSRMAMGGLGQVMDSVELMKRAWSSMNLPSTLVPTVDIEELDKRIADLKAVEQWLNVNLGMLRGTIQGLEIQRGTLAAVRAFGASVGVSTPHADPQAAAQMRADAAVQAMERAVGPRSRADASTRTATPASGVEPPSPALAPMLAGINPGAWWNLLQQNFNQVAEAALSGVGLQGAALREATVAAAGGSASKATPKATPKAPARAAARPRGAGTALGSGGASGTPGSTRTAGAKGTAAAKGTAGASGTAGTKGAQGGGPASQARPTVAAGRRTPVR